MANKPLKTIQFPGLSDTYTIPQKVSDLTNDASYATESYVDAAAASVSAIIPDVPSWALASSKPTYTYTEVGAASASHTHTAADVGALPSNTFIPEKVSDLTNDLNFMSGMTILSYGTSTWDDFLAAFSANHVVYCKASSNTNPATGSQNRMAFMAYVNNQDPASITEVEFQYYRSVSSHTYAQQGDQVYVYKLSKTSGWSVIVREAYTKIVNSTGLSSTYSNGVLTLAIDNHASTATTYGIGTETHYGHLKLSDSTTSTSSSVDGIAATPAAIKAVKDLIPSEQVNADWNASTGVASILNKPSIPDPLPAVTSADNDKVLTVVEGVWAAQSAGSGLPAVTSSDNGKVLTVISGEWIAQDPLEYTGIVNTMPVYDGGVA